MTTRKKVPIEKFDLIYVNLGKQGKIIYYDMDDRNKEHTVKCSDTPHPDFQIKMDAFRKTVAATFCMVEGWEHGIDNIKSNLDATKEAVSGRDAAVDRCKITEITITGEKMPGIKISGSFKLPLGKATFKTPNLILEKVSFEDDLQALIDAIKEEAWAYIFDGKKYQPTIEDEIAEAERERKKNERKGKKDGSNAANQTAITDKDQQQAGKN